jgi:hypothetical protein
VNPLGHLDWQDQCPALNPGVLSMRDHTRG